VQKRHLFRGTRLQQGGAAQEGLRPKERKFRCSGECVRCLISRYILRIDDGFEVGIAGRASFQDAFRGSKAYRRRIVQITHRHDARNRSEPRKGVGGNRQSRLAQQKEMHCCRICNLARRLLRASHRIFNERVIGRIGLALRVDDVPRDVGGGGIAGRSCAIGAQL
jgi:hypothetical protein